MRSLLMLLALAATAGTAGAESLGAWTYTPPEGWTVAATAADRTIYTKTVEPTFCMIGVYMPHAPQASVQADVDAEWKGIITAAWSASQVTAYPSKTTPNKLTVHATGAALDDSKGNKFYGQLMVIRGGGVTGSVLVMSNDATTIAGCFPRAKIVVDSITVGTAAAAAPSIAGTWAASTSARDPVTKLSTGSILTQYDLRADGTYTFHMENWHGHLAKPEWYVVHETGRYTADATTLTIVPKTATGVVRNDKGEVVKTSKPALEKVSYRWQLHFFEGLGETQLVLTPPKPTSRDLAGGGTSQFPGGYLYSATYKPEWRHRF